MYARVMIGTMKPGRMDEGVSIYRDSIVPAGKEQKGFKGALFLTDSKTNKAISISLWETEDDMKRGEASGYLQEQVDKLAPTFDTPSVPETYEVRVQT